MKNVLPGTVRVTLKGKAYATVIHRLHRDSVSLHQLKSIGEHEVEFYISYQSLSALRKAVFRSGCTISLHRGKGLAYDVENVVLVRSFMLWLVVAIAIVIGGSQFVWSIEFTGATPEIQQEVNEVLKKEGFQIGRLQRSLTSEDKMAPLLYDKIDNLSWMGMEWQGTKLIVRLKEKQGIEMDEQLSSSQIIASKAGTIQSMLIESGQAVENVNSVVKKGQLLVTGLVGREEDKQLVPSKGIVMAETWYEVNVTIPQTLTVETLTGNMESRTSFELFGWESPPIHFKKNAFSLATEEETIHTYELFGKEIPLKRKSVQFSEINRSKEKLEPSQAIDIAKEVAREEVLSLIGGGGSIQHEKILHEQIENGKVKLTLYIQAIEDIAEVQPYTEETRE
ncbi:sporulation protein YqfD [Jeotgalibacillus marinus]|uniref:Sporulation protein YqfD n=1 Tax=Jeotgalibacillus marinus TaxID=86667 RepID=A0ABV3Q023_9BACL